MSEYFAWNKSQVMNINTSPCILRWSSISINIDQNNLLKETVHFITKELKCLVQLKEKYILSNEPNNKRIKHVLVKGNEISDS